MFSDGDQVLEFLKVLMNQRVSIFNTLNEVTEFGIRTKVSPNKGLD